MLHDDYPVSLFPTSNDLQTCYALYVDVQTQSYALKVITSKTKKRPIARCGKFTIYYGGKIPSSLQKKVSPLSELRHIVPLEFRSALFVAKHFITFWQNHTHCHKCKKEHFTIGREGELICNNCHSESYPSISPAIILGIINNGKLLITRYANRPYKGPALVAGYCAVGESLETTCAREALEETNLEIKGPYYYFGSQPWGLSNSLLMGFFVKATSRRKLRLMDGELAHADWFTPEECKALLPKEGPISLTATMIKSFSEGLIPIN